MADRPETLHEVNLAGRLRAIGGFDPKIAGEFFGWEDRMTAGVEKFSVEILQARGWTREALLDIAEAYEDIARITPMNPSAPGRAAQLRALAALYDAK